MTESPRPPRPGRCSRRPRESATPRLPPRRPRYRPSGRCVRRWRRCSRCSAWLLHRCRADRRSSLNNELLYIAAATPFLAVFLVAARDLGTQRWTSGSECSIAGRRRSRWRSLRACKQNLRNLILFGEVGWTAVAAELLPDGCGILSNRSCRFHRHGPKVGGRAFRIARASLALSSSFAVAFPGRCSHRNLGAGRG